VAGQGKIYIDAVEREAAAFAPATVANLGPGFDWMGCAVEVRTVLKLGAEAHRGG
jgi:homoserine kinase